MRNISNADYAIVYKSKYGATEKYATMIARGLQADLINAGEKHLSETLCPYKKIIWGGGIYAGKINGMNIFRKQIRRLKNKRFFIFSVGNTPSERLDILEKVIRNSLPCGQCSEIIFHHFVARANFSCLTLSDRAMFAVRRLMIVLKPAQLRTEGERLFLSEYGKDSQVIDENAVNQFVDFVRRIEESE